MVHGDFVPGAPRDTIAALDLRTGPLDAWEFPFAACLCRQAGNVLYLSTIDSTRRVPRRHLAAASAASGDRLPWEPGALLPASEVPVNGLEFRAAGVPAGRDFVRVRAVNANGTRAAGHEMLVEVG